MSFPVGDVRNFFTVASVPIAGSPSGEAMPVDARTTVHNMQSPGARGGGGVAGSPLRRAGNAGVGGQRGGRGGRGGRGVRGG